MPHKSNLFKIKHQSVGLFRNKNLNRQAQDFFFVLFVALSLDDLVNSLFSILTQISTDVEPNCTSKLLTATTVRAPLCQKVAKIKSSTSFHTKTMPSYGNSSSGSGRFFRHVIIIIPRCPFSRQAPSALHESTQTCQRFASCCVMNTKGCRFSHTNISRISLSCSQTERGLF